MLTTILGVAPLLAWAAIGAVGAVAGWATRKQVADHYDEVAGGLTAKNRRRFEAELDKMIGLLERREEKKETAQRGAALEDLLLQELVGPGGVNVPPALGAAGPEEAPGTEPPPLGPTAGLEIDEGAMLADTLGVDRGRVRTAARTPMPPSLALFGGGQPPPP
jgi:hypothetical protein